jgi:hypothetical protein
MIDHAATFRAHQRARFLRPDAARFVRPDVARYLRPRSDPVEVFPALDRKYSDAGRARDRCVAADIEREQALLGELRRELATVSAELLGRRLSSGAHYKYSPTQRRIPAGQPGGGRWTDEQGGGGGGAGGPAAPQTEAGSGGEDVVATDEAPFAFQGVDSSGSLDDWNALLDGLNVDSRHNQFRMQVPMMPKSMWKISTRGAAAGRGAISQAPLPGSRRVLIRRSRVPRTR